ncbi:MAG: Ribonuclease [Actinomycetota bacterium]
MNPNLKLERELLAQDFEYVIGIDEVGRGAFGGPVSVGVCAVTENMNPAPSGIKDSKLLTAVAREKLAPEVKNWAAYWAVGDAEPHEIDELGINQALRLAALRALNEIPISRAAIILDGSFDWLSPPPANLFETADDFEHTVLMKVKADQTCLSVAAASVLAKVHRDGLMRHLDGIYPGYGWASHVGYGTSAHREAIAKLGLSPAHRKSWKLQ